MKGDLAEGVLPGLLRDLYVGRSTGLLSFTRGRERRSVQFVRGNMVHADTSVKDDRLGETMVRHGLLRRADLDRATAVVTRSGRRVGLVLEQLGVIDRDQLADALALHIHEILVKVFAWKSGAFEFEPQAVEVLGQYDLALKLSTGEMILEAIRHVRSPRIIRYGLGDLDRILILSTDPLLRFQRLRLSPIDGYTLSRVDGSSTAREILDIVPVPAEDAERSLFGLLCTGLVEYLPACSESAPTPEVLRGQIVEAYAGRAVHDHFQVLGIGRDAGEAEVKAAYFRMARRFHPDIQHIPVLAELRSEIEAVFARLCVAYKVLSDPHRRAEYESRLQLARAGTVAPEPEPFEDPAARAARGEAGLATAEADFAAGKYWDAIQALRETIPLTRSRVRHRAQLLLAQCYLKNPKWTRRAEHELLHVIEEDPTNAEAYCALGAIYKAGGLTGRAVAMFRRALEVKPKHAVAQAELQALAYLPDSEGGLLKRLLRRG